MVYNTGALIDSDAVGAPAVPAHQTWRVAVTPFVSMGMRNLRNESPRCPSAVGRLSIAHIPQLRHLARADVRYRDECVCRLRPCPLGRMPDAILLTRARLVRGAGAATRASAQPGCAARRWKPHQDLGQPDPHAVASETTCPIVSHMRCICVSSSVGCTRNARLVSPSSAATGRRRSGTQGVSAKAGSR